MSSKATLIYTDNCEHWYHDVDDNSIIIDIHEKHLMGYDELEKCYIFEVKPGTPLHKELCKKGFAWSK